MGFSESPPHPNRSEEHTSELQSRPHLVCRLLLEKKKSHLQRQQEESRGLEDCQSQFQDSTLRLRNRAACRDSTSQSGFFFFFNDTATTEIYTLSLHDALPI